MLLTETIVWAFLVMWPGNTEDINGYMFPELYHYRSPLACESNQKIQRGRREKVNTSIGRRYMDLSPCLPITRESLERQIRANRWLWVTGRMD